MSASVLRGMSDSAWNEHDVGSAALLLAPSAIMAYACLYLRQAVTANILYHAFMLAAILGHGWSLSIPRNARRHEEGRVHKKYAHFRVRSALVGLGMFATGVVVYLVCRSFSRPGEYLGVDRFALRETLDEFGVSSVREMLLFAFYFSVANPWLEEIFWRQLMRWRIRLDVVRYVGERKPHRAARIEAACRHADAVSAVAYSAYHSVIIYSLMPPWFNLGVAFPFLAVLAQVLNRAADRPGVGVDACVALHAGLDAASALWILDLRFGWLDG
eukprot:CAMPEP_0119261012 /NCGR_PEP_ID=MMETSP1329-20130426/1207_1 /TAXON_ID=114041 /ORGANISM="Genus nov. species nov., Strain RCC1024" /LENGTH=271 /DNA_ID=CAMNT_0007260503 /DNA_START=205 /DNA_END=1017 /DNA_ORIENTATION=-